MGDEPNKDRANMESWFADSEEIDAWCEGFDRLVEAMNVQCAIYLAVLQRSNQDN